MTPRNKPGLPQQNAFVDLTGYVKKRKSSDRRRGPTKLGFRYLFTGRRRELRRAEEVGDGYYVDRFSLRDVIPPIALILFALADLVLTALWYRSGGAETHTALAWLAGNGGAWFSIAKCVLVLLAAGFFLVHARFRIARVGLGILLCLSVCLIAYHGYNLGRVGVDPGAEIVMLFR